MLHPALAQALATAHIEDLRRAAARRDAIRAARPVAHEPHIAATSKAPHCPVLAELRALRAPGLRHNTNRDSSCGPAATPIGRRRPLGGESRDRLGTK
jgi:hypothetical protein